MTELQRDELKRLIQLFASLRSLKILHRHIDDRRYLPKFRSVNFTARLIQDSVEVEGVGDISKSLVGKTYTYASCC
jgi:hypothetical protein